MVGVLLCSILVFPEWIIRQDVGGQVKNLTPEQLAKAKNDIRTTLLQAVAGIVLVLGAIATWRQLRLSRMQLFLTREQAELASIYSNEQLALTREQVRQAQEGTQQELRLAREGQITDRFTRAIDHLGNEELDVRLGGIYALVRIAHDSPPDQQAITDILAAYIRRHSPWPPAPGDQYAATAPIDEIPELRIRAADVQAALSALGRGLSKDDVLDLSDVDLRKADLAGCHLEHAFFSSSHLESSNLTRAHLRRALFLFCDLSDVVLRDAHLEGACFDNTTLDGVLFAGTSLNHAEFKGMDLTRAEELNMADMLNAPADLETRWPEGFDSGSAVST